MAVLGLERGASLGEARAAYRALLRTSHPDVDNGMDAGDRTRAIVAAYRRIMAEPVEFSAVWEDASTPYEPDPTNEGAPGGPTPTPTAEPFAWRLSDDTVVLACPVDEAFLALLNVANSLGDVTYVDRNTGFLEALVRTDEGCTLSMVVSLQGRANGGTEAFVTIEPVGLAHGMLPLIADVTNTIVALLVA